MKTTRTIAWTALAGLLVIGPLTMTRAHDFPWPGPFHGDMLPGSQVSSGSGSVSLLTVDLKVEGFTAQGLAESTETFPVGEEFEIIRVNGLTDYIVIVTPGAQEDPVIQIDVSDRAKLIGHMHRSCDGFSGTAIYCPKAADRPTVMVSTGQYEAGLDPQTALDAATAGALAALAGAAQK
jgi:hypothetical protein